MKPNEQVTGLSATNFNNQIVVHLEHTKDGELTHQRMLMVNTPLGAIFLNANASGTKSITPEDVTWLKEVTTKNDDHALLEAIKGFKPNVVADKPQPKPSSNVQEPTRQSDNYRPGDSSVRATIAALIARCGHTGDKKSQTSADLAKAASKFCKERSYDMKCILTKRQKDALLVHLNVAFSDTTRKPVDSKYRKQGIKS